MKTYEGYDAVLFLLRVYMSRGTTEIHVFTAKRKSDSLPVVMFRVGDERGVMSIRQVSYLPTCCELALARSTADEPSIREALEAVGALARQVAEGLEGVSSYGPH
jgi:hypothetical protein